METATGFEPRKNGANILFLFPSTTTRMIMIRTIFCHVKMVVTPLAKQKTHKIDLFNFQIGGLRKNWLSLSYWDQCDQMAIFFHSLALYIIENLPISIKIARGGTKVCKYQTNTIPNCPKDC